MTEFETSKVYVVDHRRKGRFALAVTSITDEWVTGIIVDGRASAIHEYNERAEGEEITVRKSFLTIVEA